MPKRDWNVSRNAVSASPSRARNNRTVSAHWRSYGSPFATYSCGPPWNEATERLGLGPAGAKPSGLGSGIAVADVDGDGDLDLLVADGGLLRNESGRFVEWAASGIDHRNAFGACFVPQTTGGGWSPDDLWSIALWGVVALFVASRRFSTEPSTGERTPRRISLRSRPAS